MKKLKRPILYEYTIVKVFGIDFNYSDKEHDTLTLDISEVYKMNKELTNKDLEIIHTREHSDGWVISGKIHEDYYTWVNEFVAEHPTHGYVWGDFNDRVYADTEDTYRSFMKKHSPHSWDMGDI